MKNFVSKEVLYQRIKESKAKEEVISIIVEPGTKDRIKSQGLRISSYVRKLIEEDLRRREE